MFALLPITFFLTESKCLSLGNVLHCRFGKYIFAESFAP